MPELDPIIFHGPESLTPELIAYPPDAPPEAQRLVGFSFLGGTLELNPE